MTPCDTKDTYPSRARAERVGRRRMHDDRTVILRAYYCKLCGKYHLTSKPDRFARKQDDE